VIAFRGIERCNKIKSNKWSNVFSRSYLACLLNNSHTWQWNFVEICSNIVEHRQNSTYIHYACHLHGLIVFNSLAANLANRRGNLFVRIFVQFYSCCFSSAGCIVVWSFAEKGFVICNEEALTASSVPWCILLQQKLCQPFQHCEAASEHDYTTAIIINSFSQCLAKVSWDPTNLSMWALTLSRNSPKK
jgi:hypothetical protein